MHEVYPWDSGSSLSDKEKERPEILFIEAVQSLEANRILEAKDRLEHLMRAHPAYGKTYNFLGFIEYERYENTEEAEEYYKKCLELSPDYPPVYFNYADLLYNEGAWKPLKKLLKQAREVKGINQFKLSCEFGKLYEAQSKFGRASKYYLKALEAAKTEKKVDFCWEAVRRCLEKEALRAMHENRPADAARQLFYLQRRFPESGRILNHLGYLYETRFKEPDTAERYYWRALDLEPDYPATYKNYAVLLSRHERWEDLEELLKKASGIRGIPDNLINFEHGQMAEMKGNLEEAIEYYTRGLKASESDEDVTMFEKAVRRCEKKSDYLTGLGR